jgi:DNA-binding MurR/RpiR family transcriptional regulator
VQVVDGVGGMASEIGRLVRPHDAVLAVTFTPYAAETMDFASSGAARGAAVVAITDGPLSPIVPLARVRLEVVEASLEGFRSTAATFCVAMALAVAVGSAKGDSPRT